MCSSLAGLLRTHTDDLSWGNSMALGDPLVDGYALWIRERLGSSTFLPQGKDAHLSASGYKVLAEALAARLLQPKPGQGCPIVNVSAGLLGGSNVAGPGHRDW